MENIQEIIANFSPGCSKDKKIGKWKERHAGYKEGESPMWSIRDKRRTWICRRGSGTPQTSEGENNHPPFEHAKREKRSKNPSGRNKRPVRRYKGRRRERERKRKASES